LIMLNFTGRLWLAALLPTFVALCAPNGAMAYNTWQMEHDQATVNDLSQEGVLSVPQALRIDQEAYNRRMQSWLNSHPGSNFMVGTAPAGVVPMQTPGQVRTEDRQIDKLERDHMITWQQANNLKSQLNAEANAFRLQQNSVSGRLLTNGYSYQPTAIPTAYPAQAVYPTQQVVYPTQQVVYPTAQAVYPATQAVYPATYYNPQSVPLIQRVRGFLNY
jgi:hypothetical protein